MSKSCEGCKFLFGDGDGYSDYTWMETNVSCALDKNPNLPTEELYESAVGDLPAVKSGRCDRFSPGEYLVISPDGDLQGDWTDAAQEAAIRAFRYVEGNE